MRPLPATSGNDASFPCLVSIISSLEALATVRTTSDGRNPGAEHSSFWNAVASHLGGKDGPMPPGLVAGFN